MQDLQLPLQVKPTVRISFTQRKEKKKDPFKSFIEVSNGKGWWGFNYLAE